MPNNAYNVFIAKAKKAEVMADRFGDDFLKSSWLNIAQSYRELAEAEQAKHSSASALPFSPIASQK
jgi:hypothetical protein